MIRGTTGRDHFDRDHLGDSPFDTSLEDGISGRYGAPRPRGTGAHNFDRSDLMAGSRDEFSHYASGASRGYGGHRAAGAAGYDSDDDASDDDNVTGMVNGPRSGGTRGHRGMLGQDFASFDDDSFAGEATRPRYGGTRGPRFGGHGGMVREDFASFDDDSFTGESPSSRFGGARGSHGYGSSDRYGDDSTTDFAGNSSDGDDESDCPPPRGRRGAAASTRRGHDSHPVEYEVQSPVSRRHEIPSHPRRSGMHSRRRAGTLGEPADSLGADRAFVSSVGGYSTGGYETGLGGHDSGARHYGSQRGLGSFGGYEGGRNLGRRY